MKYVSPPLCVQLLLTIITMQTEELQKRMQGLQEQYTDLIATCERIKTRIAQTS